MNKFSWKLSTEKTLTKPTRLPIHLVQQRCSSRAQGEAQSTIGLEHARLKNCSGSLDCGTALECRPMIREFAWHSPRRAEAEACLDEIRKRVNKPCGTTHTQRRPKESEGERERAREMMIGAPTSPLSITPSQTSSLSRSTTQRLARSHIRMIIDIFRISANCSRSITNFRDSPSIR